MDNFVYHSNLQPRVESIASSLLFMPPAQRRNELYKLLQSNWPLYALVCQRLKSLRVSNEDLEG